jgi:excinuclease ABC subunit A
MPDWIHIKGARQNNLKNIDVSIPKHKLVVITGPSGAGKSSLAFDTLYAEGNRRYVESLSPSARQFLNQLEKPDVDAVEGLSPAIAVEQRAGAPNPRSTVGTVSDIYDYLRLLYARVAEPICFRCEVPMRSHTTQQIVDEALARPGQPRLMVLAPVAYDPALDFQDVLRRFRKEGFARIRMGGALHVLEEPVTEPRKPPADLAIVTDRLALKGADKQRLTEAVELALAHGGGQVRLVFLEDGGAVELAYSRVPRCGDCGVTYPEPHPRLFSFNSPQGACPTCHGLGTELSVATELVVPDASKSLAEGAIVPWEKKASLAFHQMIEQVATHYGFSIFTPFKELAARHREILLRGSGTDVLEFRYEGEGSAHRYSRPFEGVVPNLERRFRETESPSVREEIRRFMSERECSACDGRRLRPEALQYRLGGCSVSDLARLSLDVAERWVGELTLPPFQAQVAGKLLHEVRARLGFLRNVGLHYLSLDRPMDSLSTGENQRIRLATQIGSALSGVIYILDEPTIGLHARDTDRLLATLIALRDTGNTVVVVEHDRDAMLRADWLIEIGPQAGESGGQLVAAGTPEDLRRHPGSVTGAYLAGRRGIAQPAKRRPRSWQKLVLSGAQGNNLKDVTLELPLGMFVCVTGVSGSGKSTLVLDTLYPALQAHLESRPSRGLPYAALAGVEYLDRVIHIDQAPIGKSARSNPGTYLGVFNLIREQFAAVPDSRARGYGARRFSFNVEGGRCEACQGEGNKRIEMYFLPDVFVKCDVCDGTRFNRETLEIRYRGRSIADVLALTLSEVELFFRAVPGIRTRLTPLLDVGLGYLRLGQPANTLSGGEAQRLKIARELGRRDGGRTLYLMDEPTTGLHVEDIERLLQVIQQLVSAGHSVVVIEHHLEMIKCADHVIDLGPEGGAAGGRIIAEGTPEQVVERSAFSHTAKYLHPYLRPPAAGAGTLGRSEGKVLA